MPASNTPDADLFFTAFKDAEKALLLPGHFTMTGENGPHPMCISAATELQEYLSTQQDWVHNFGLSGNGGGAVIGKMFGVLVVKTSMGEAGYLAAFSGKLAGSNHHAKFVPPVFDALTEGSFLNRGMAELAGINSAIKKMDAEKPLNYCEQIRALKDLRKRHSTALQQQLFNHYHFRNSSGREKSLAELFLDAGYKNPPAGAGECAAPKLLQYAFRHRMKPLALAEFWWGQSPKSAQWKHKFFYPCCREKCAPILTHMLGGIDCGSF